MGRDLAARTSLTLTWYFGTVEDELAPLDATAQAELVRRGERRPIDLVDAAIRHIEQ